MQCRGAIYTGDAAWLPMRAGLVFWCASEYPGGLPISYIRCKGNIEEGTLVNDLRYACVDAALPVCRPR